MSDISPVEIAHTVKKIITEKFAAECNDQEAGLAWYEDNINVWDGEKLVSHAPDDAVRDAGAAIALEGCPPGEVARDCWGVDITYDADVLKAIPGWYLECYACHLIYPVRNPDLEELRSRSDR